MIIRVKMDLIKKKTDQTSIIKVCHSQNSK